MNDHVARAFTAVNDKKALEQIEKAENHIYQNYQNAYNAYKDLHGFIAENRREVFSMNRKKRLKVAGSLLFSILTFIPGCIVTNNNQAIIGVFAHLFGK